MVSSCQEIPWTPVTAPIVDALGLQHRTLLDVQLDVRGRRQARAGQRPGVADALQLVAQAGAVDGPQVERLLERHAAHVDERAEHVRREAGALLVGEEGDRQRAGGLDAGLLQGLDDLEAGQHAVVPVVAATGADGVDVRADHHRRALADVPQPDDVADGVDGDRRGPGPASRRRRGPVPARSSSVRASRQQPPSPVAPISASASSRAANRAWSACSAVAGGGAIAPSVARPVRFVKEEADG